MVLHYPLLQASARLCLEYMWNMETKVAEVIQIDVVFDSFIENSIKESVAGIHLFFFINNPFLTLASKVV